jgi:hypothetical protein
MLLRSGKNTLSAMSNKKRQNHNQTQTQTRTQTRTPLPTNIACIDYKRKYYSLIWYMFEIYMLTQLLNILLVVYFRYIIYPSMK